MRSSQLVRRVSGSKVTKVRERSSMRASTADDQTLLELLGTGDGWAKKY